MTNKKSYNFKLSAKSDLFERCVYVEPKAIGMLETPIYKLNFESKQPDYDEITAEQKNQLLQLLTVVEETIQSGRQEIIEDVLDVNSFAAMYVFAELFKDVDYTYDSDYFYIKNGKLFAGPIWDMELSMGNVSDQYEFWPYYVYSNQIVDGHTYGNGSGDSTQGTWGMEGWYQELMNYDFFASLVHEKFMEVEEAYENLYREGGVIDSLVAAYSDSFEKNYRDTYWDITMTYSEMERNHPDATYQENVNYLKDWLRNRKKWVYHNLCVEEPTEP